LINPNFQSGKTVSGRHKTRFLPWQDAFFAKRKLFSIDEKLFHGMKALFVKRKALFVKQKALFMKRKAISEQIWRKYG
jgi:hypothetical protein